MKVLITGACGFIGFHICKKLIQNDYEVLGIDNFNSYYDISLKESRFIALDSWIGFKPKTTVMEGVEQFVTWYRNFYKI